MGAVETALRTPRGRRGLLLASLAAAVAIVSAAATTAWWIVSLGPAPLGEGLAFSTVVLDRDGRLLRPYTTAEGRWRLPGL